MFFIGRRLLPRRSISDASAATPAASLLAQYQLGERLFRLRVPAESPVADKTLAEVQINHVLDVQVVGIRRSASSELAPGPKTALRVGDVLLVRGRQERLQELAGWRLLADDDETPVLKVLLAESFELAEIQVADNTDLAGKSVRQVGFHERFGATLLGLRRGSITVETRLTEEVLNPATPCWCMDRARPSISSAATRSSDEHLARPPRNSLPITTWFSAFWCCACPRIQTWRGRTCSPPPPSR